MNILRMTIRNVAIMMLTLILIMPTAVHGHTLELLGAETTHAVGGGCHDPGNDVDHNPAEGHQFDIRCCELDTPYVLPSSPYFTTPAVTGRLVYPFSSRQLDGYSRRIYKPPR